MEASLIGNALDPVLLALHHIGSTAIPGVVAKPIIDMLAVVTSIDALDRVSPNLESLGYEARGELGIPGRRYFRKYSPTRVRTHHLHAFAVVSPEIDRHLDFRDFLRAHPADAHAYEMLKRRLAAELHGDRAAYSDGKTEFIREVDRRAAEWRRATETS